MGGSKEEQSLTKAGRTPCECRGLSMRWSASMDGRQPTVLGAGIMSHSSNLTDTAPHVMEGWRVSGAEKRPAPASSCRQSHRPAAVGRTATVSRGGRAPLGCLQQCQREAGLSPGEADSSGR